MFNRPFKENLSSIKTDGKPGLLRWSNLSETFNTKRILCLSDFADLSGSNKTRGKHANADCNELLFVVEGGVNISLEGDGAKFNFKCKKNDYVFIPINYYLEIDVLSKDTVCFVLCDSIR